MDRQKKIVKTSFIGITTNIALVIVKALVGFMANSIAIILEAVNNLSDVLSAVITIIGVKLSNKAPDKKHPYGHGRIEYFSSLIIGVIILLAGFASLKEAIEKIFNPLETHYNLVTFIVVAIAVIVKLFLGTYYKRVGKSINSQGLIASGTDALADSAISFTTLVAVIFGYFTHINIEGYLGAIISVLILKSAFEILRETIDTIIGIRADSELTQKLRERLEKFDEVQGAYDLMLHYYGPNKIVGSVHIQVRNDMTAEEIHILTRKIEYKIFEELGIILTIGIYAANDEGEFGDIKQELLKITNDYEHVLQVHGFYVDKENKNIYFDLIIDFDCKDRSHLCSQIVKKIKKKYPEFKYNVIIDNDIAD